MKNRLFASIFILHCPGENRIVEGLGLNHSFTLHQVVSVHFRSVFRFQQCKKEINSPGRLVLELE